MSTRRQVVGADPINIVSTLSLANGSKYLVENSSDNTIAWAEAAIKPDPSIATTPFRRLAPFAIIGITVGSEGFWFWSRSPGDLAIDEEG